MSEFFRGLFSNGGSASPAPESERQRIPQPLIKKRAPSGRGAMEQPNLTSYGPAALTPRFWLMIILTGIAAGLFGDLMMLILFSVQHIAFNYHSGSLQDAAIRLARSRRVLVLVIAGFIGAIGWYLIRRYMKNEKTDFDDAVWSGGGELGFRRSLLTSSLAELVIGMGASIGREAAPKLMGGASGSVLGKWAGLTPAQRSLLVACGGGAGFAAVYNVPLGAALFTAEVLCGSMALPIILPALVCSIISTATAWIYLPDRATYLNIPDYHTTTSLLIWSVLIGPVIGVVTAAYIRLLGWVSHHRTKGRQIFISFPMAMLVLGLVGCFYPQLFGNGKDMAHSAFIGGGSLVFLFAMASLKPLVTSMTIYAGGSGGLFTPSLSTGAVLGGFLGGIWLLIWPGTPLGAFAMVGAVAMLSASMLAPLAALALVLELTHSGFQLIVPMMGASVIATIVAWHIDGYSIYSIRLPAAGETGGD
ncbi:MAG TPA: chloride channel protein [Acidimicrobiales bacterium]|nr:chloride channel protein [Acidimicrobiales bacterium]